MTHHGKESEGVSREESKKSERLEKVSFEPEVLYNSNIQKHSFPIIENSAKGEFCLASIPLSPFS